MSVTGYIFLGTVAALVMAPIITVLVVKYLENAAWYNRRMIRQYRRDLPKMHTYQITTSSRMFGPPFYSCEHVCKAYELNHAAKRYFAWYRRHYKEVSDHEDVSNRETKPMWGHLCLVDKDTGYTHYIGQ